MNKKRKQCSASFKSKVALAAPERSAHPTWYTRDVLFWRISNTIDIDFCVDALEEALQRYGALEIFNTDKGVQFTSEAF